MKKQSLATHIVVANNSNDKHHFDIGENVVRLGDFRIQPGDRNPRARFEREKDGFRNYLLKEDIIEIGSDEHKLMEEIIKQQPK